MKLAQPPQQRNVPIHSLRLAGLCLLVATSLLVAACGGSDNGNTSSHAAAAPKSTPSAKSSPGTVNLSPEGDQLMFDANQLTAKAGKVTIDFTNDSNQSHDVVLIDSANNVLGQTPVFDGGTKSFSVALKSGTYTYYCSVPGHRQAGMQGTLTVK
ncbi:MAG: plastocyanin/azurin family copper-binding protein [Thermoleophilia bacterium]